MHIYGDYHTHTVFSHGKGTVEENIVSAINAGLKEIALTDHGFRHVMFNISRKKFSRQREEVRVLREKYPEIKILLGLETNLQGNNGAIDIRPSDLEDLDILICGYHKMATPAGFGQFFKFWMPNFCASTFRHTSKRRKIKNTDAYLNAMNRFPIDIVSHLNYGVDADIIEIAKEAKRLGTFIELNGKRICMTDAEAEGLIATGAGLIVSSDAHSPKNVGNFSLPETFIKKFGIPEAQIMNAGKRPVFRREREKKNTEN
jgi:putative hydrolase